MEEGLIGVIVPVYKVEKYIAECIESILAQTYTNFRLILIDDGTPDNAGKICDEYAKKDSRITIIHQENAGVTRARARGVEEADDCEFITFVDGDDTILPDALSAFMHRVDKNTHIVYGQHKDSVDNIDYFTAEEYTKGLIEMSQRFIQAPWGKLFRKCLFNTTTFDIPREIVIGEDTIMNVRLAINNKENVAFIKNRIYNYRTNENGISANFKDNLKYQYVFYKYLIESIPANITHLYYDSIITRKLTNWSTVYRYSSKKIDEDDIPFIKELKQDIKMRKYKISIFDKIQLNTDSRLIRFISIKIRRLIMKINHSDGTR